MGRPRTEQVARWNGQQCGLRVLNPQFPVGVQIHRCERGPVLAIRHQAIDSLQKTLSDSVEL